MAEEVETDEKKLDRALTALGLLTYNERDLNIYRPYAGSIGNAVQEYFAKNREYREFVGVPELVTDVQQVCLDAPRNGLWKDADATDWRQTPTGIGTYDNVYPEAASAAIQMSNQPPHWGLQFGIMEIGSANNAMNINLARVNGKPRGVCALQNQVRLPALKVRRFAKGLFFKDRGDFNEDVEFETTATTEIYPFAIHILPGEIAKATAVQGYVTTIAA